MRLKFAVWLTVLLAAVGSVRAHRVKVFAYAEGRTVLGRGWFGGGGRPKNCPVLVFLPDGKLLLETRTDTAGAFRFEVPVRADLRIVLKAGFGHQAEYLLRADELPTDLPSPSVSSSRPTTTSAAPPLSAGSRPGAPAGGRTSSLRTTLNREDLRRILRTEIQGAIGPLREQIAEAARPGPTEIIGGIGYIIGLMGLAAYFRGRYLARKVADDRS